MSNPIGSTVRSEQNQSPRAVRPGVPIHCRRCNQLLAFSRGDELDCFVFAVRHRVTMKCEVCKHETRWGPDKAKADVDTAEKPE